MTTPMAGYGNGAGPRALVSFYARRRFAILLCSLLATIALGPLLKHMGFGDRILEGCLAVSLLVAVLPFFRERSWIVLAVFAGVVLAVRLASGLLGWHAASSASLLAWAVVASIAAWHAVHYALRATRVDSEHLCAGLSVYLLAGVFWGVAFAAVERLVPGSFLVAGAVSKGDFILSDGIYYSFVTLATLGYGDISPVGAIARGLAVFEAVFGQLYLAVLVAGLVSLRIVSRSERRESDD